MLSFEWDLLCSDFPLLQLELGFCCLLCERVGGCPFNWLSAVLLESLTGVLIRHKCILVLRCLTFLRRKVSICHRKKALLLNLSGGGTFMQGGAQRESATLICASCWSCTPLPRERCWQWCRLVASRDHFTPQEGGPLLTAPTRKIRTRKPKSKSSHRIIKTRSLSRLRLKRKREFWKRHHRVWYPKSLDTPLLAIKARRYQRRR